MDDEFSDLFLLNDCLISGRLSPGPPDAPDDFLGQGTYDGMLMGSNGHNGEIPASFMCFDGGDPDLGYPTSDSPRRSSLGPASATYPKTVTNNGFFAYVKTEGSSSPLSPSGRSPDHDYITDVKMEGVLAENGGSGHGGGSICSSKTAPSMEYCHGTVGDGTNDNGISLKYAVDDYYADTVETKPLRTNGDTRVVASSHTIGANPMVGVGGLLFTNGVTSAVITAAADASVISVGEVDGDNLAAKSEALDGDAWPCGPVLPRGEDDAVPSGDDNSSTTSGDSCSNCGYLSSGSPAPGQKHAGHITYSSHHQGNGLHRYRSANSAGSSGLNLNLRTRSKMHELALKHNLISEQVSQSDPRNKGYVLLSTEERRTLIQEGLPVPTKLPLSKQEEEALKIVRRKIKNKLSAQESRRKRKEYMETLEQQIEGYQSENTSLRRRIDALEKSNQSLLGQLKKLQQQISPTNSPTTATALIVGNGHGASFDNSTTSRGGSNMHHTVSLAAVFLLFAVMIPAMPIWPSVFRNAFIATPMMTKTSHEDASASHAYFHHSSNTAAFPASRVLWSGGGGDCEIPYSAEYFEKLNECSHDSPADSVEESQPMLLYAAVVNYTDKSDRVSDDHIGLLAAAESQVSSTAVCETSACREALATGKTVANA